MVDKSRIVDLQKSLTIARRALEKIVHQSCDPVREAEDALYSMIPLDQKRPIQGLVGHAKQENARG